MTVLAPWEPIFRRKLKYGTQVKPGAVVGLSPVMPPTCPITATVTDASITDVQAVAISNGYAYVGSFFDSTITAIDISDPTAPVVVDSITDADFFGVAGLAVSGTTLFAASEGSAAVVSIDISNPASMSILDSLTDAQINGPDGIAISGTHAYLADFDGDAIVSIDISNPSAMTVADSLSDSNLNGAFDLVIIETNAYVLAINSNMLVSVDISNPGTLTIDDTESIPLTSPPHGLAASGDHVFIANDESANNNVTSIDVSTPTAMTVADVFVDAAFVNPGDITINGTTAYVTSANSGDIVAVDISDPTNLALIDTVHLTDIGTLWAIDDVDGFLYVTVIDEAHVLVVDERCF